MFPHALCSKRLHFDLRSPPGTLFQVTGSSWSQENVPIHTPCPPLLDHLLSKQDWIFCPNRTEQPTRAGRGYFSGILLCLSYRLQWKENHFEFSAWEMCRTLTDTLFWSVESNCDLYVLFCVLFLGRTQIKTLYIYNSNVFFSISSQLLTKMLVSLPRKPYFWGSTKRAPNVILSGIYSNPVYPPDSQMPQSGRHTKCLVSQPAGPPASQKPPAPLSDVPFCLLWAGTHGSHIGQYSRQNFKVVPIISAIWCHIHD